MMKEVSVFVSFLLFVVVTKSVANDGLSVAKDDLKIISDFPIQSDFPFQFDSSVVNAGYNNGQTIENEQVIDKYRQRTNDDKNDERFSQTTRCAGMSWQAGTQKLLCKKYDWLIFRYELPFVADITLMNIVNLDGAVTSLSTYTSNSTSCIAYDYTYSHNIMLRSSSNYGFIIGQCASTTCSFEVAMAIVWDCTCKSLNTNTCSVMMVPQITVSYQYTQFYPIVTSYCASSAGGLTIDNYCTV